MKAVNELLNSTYSKDLLSYFKWNSANRLNFNIDDFSCDMFFLELLQGVLLSHQLCLGRSYHYDENPVNSFNIVLFYPFDSMVLNQNDELIIAPRRLYMMNMAHFKSKFMLLPKLKYECINFYINVDEFEKEGYVRYFKLNVRKVFFEKLANKAFVEFEFNTQIDELFNQIYIYHQNKALDFLRLKFLELLYILEHDCVVSVKQDYIKDILNELDFNFDIKALCAKYQISQSKLRNDFLKAYKMPIGEFIGKQKLKKAQKMLIDENLSIAQIANELGYLNPAKFSSFFKKHYKISPKEFKLKNSRGIEI